jgi:hypothetical protein
VNGICSSGLHACCCQPAAVGGVIYADLWGELNTHLAPQALFTQSSPVHKPLLQAFPFPTTPGEVTLPLLLWPVCLFTAHMGGWVFPPFLWSFPPSATLTSFPAPGCWVRNPLLPEPLRPGRACLFTVPGGIPLSPSSALRVPHPLCNVSLLFLLLITQFLFFPQMGVGLSRGLC